MQNGEGVHLHVRLPLFEQRLETELVHNKENKGRLNATFQQGTTKRQELISINLRD